MPLLNFRAPHIFTLLIGLGHFVLTLSLFI